MKQQQRVLPAALGSEKPESSGSRILSRWALGATVLVLGICATSAAWAQTLPEAVSLAVQSHPLVSSSKAGYKAAEQGIGQARAGLLPTVNLSADTGYQDAKRPGTTSTDDDQYRNSESVTISQLLFDGFATTKEVESSRETAEAARHGVLSAATQIAQRTVRAYLDVLRERELVNLAADNVQLHDRILSDVQEAARTGGGAGADVSQVRTRLFLAQSQRRRFEGNLRNAVTNFIEAVGQAPDNLTRPQLPAGNIPASLDDAVNVALKNNPDLLSSLGQERAATATAASTRGAFFPTFSLELSHERRDDVDATLGVAEDTTALLQMNWDLYAGGGDLAARRRALAQRSEARFKTREIDRLLREQLATALNDYEVAGDQAEILRQRVATAGDVQSAYAQQFRLGQRTTLDFLDSGNELFLARTELASVEYDRLRAAYDLMAASGTLLTHLGVNVDTAGPLADQ